jgi:hypothetical protein
VRVNEAEARRWLCAELPDLRRSAQAGGWTSALEDALTALDEGGTALDVIALLGPGPVPDDRDDTAFLPFGTYDTDVVGEYVCPVNWCARHAGRDERGRPPRCELRGRPMRFTES